jgi:release factor glutamine methyltransferase
MPVTTTVGSVRHALGASTDALRAAGVPDARRDAELLLAEAMGCETVQLAANPEEGVPAPMARKFGEMLRRRLRREPVAYILGRKGFRNIELAVDRRVLIPRPETELLAQVAVELAPQSVLDVGTGSGALALAIADELPQAEITATDTSAEALDVARANAERLGLTGRIQFRQGTVPPGDFDLTVANLPYIREDEWGGLAPEIREFEPPEALLGGPDGLDAIRCFLSPGAALWAVTTAKDLTAKDLEVSTSILALEVGAGQAPAVGELLQSHGFTGIETRRDLAGIERVVIGRR